MIKELKANYEAAKYFWFCYWYNGLGMGEATQFSEWYLEQMLGEDTKPKGKWATKLDAHLDRRIERLKEKK